MTNKQKIVIAKSFVSFHKMNNIDQWTPQNLYGDQKYMRIYSNLIGDIYGEISTENTIEISGHDSKTGNPIIFVMD